MGEHGTIRHFIVKVLQNCELKCRATTAFVETLDSEMLITCIKAATETQQVQPAK